MNIGLILFFIGIALLGISGFSYRWRAFRNKKAWDGSTIPLLLLSLPFLIISLILIYINYPK